MKNFIGLYLLIILVLTSCSTSSAHLPTSTSSHTTTLSSTPKPTETFTPTITPTRTPRPTATSRPELTAADVGLPWDPDQTMPILVPCYMDSTTFNHRGDGIVFSRIPDKIYYVLAPISGTIILAGDMTDKYIGWEINFATDFAKDGKQVFLDFVHTSGLVPGLSVGQHVERGQPLLILDRHWGGNPGEVALFLDIAIRNGPTVNDPKGKPVGYFSFLDLVKDDLENLPSNSYQWWSHCCCAPGPN